MDHPQPSRRRLAVSLGILSLALLLVLPAGKETCAQTMHTHDWSVNPTMQSRGVVIKTSSNFFNAGRTVGISFELGRINGNIVTANQDYDTCLNSGCNIADLGPVGTVRNSLKALCWTASRPGGQFGYRDGTGQFVPSNDPALITTYKFPPSPGAITLGVKIDDIPERKITQTSTIPTADDPPAIGARTLNVIGYSDDSSWTVATPISSGGILAPGSREISPTCLVTCTAAVATDVDERVGTSAGTTQEPDECTYTWTASGGRFLADDGSGNFAPSTSAHKGREVHWEAPSTTSQHTLTLTVDDQNDANRGGGTVSGTRNDPAVQHTITVQVGSPAIQWGPEGFFQGQTKTGRLTGGIAAPPDGGQVDPGQAVACSALEAIDEDYRRLSDGTIQWVADTPTYTWSATGGSFQSGLNTGPNVTWIAPIRTGTIHVLTLTLDDQNDANLPAGEGASRNDAAKRYQVVVEVGHCPPVTTFRLVQADDACGCPGDVLDAAMPVSPRTGAARFEVPVTSWAYRGTTLDLSLNYSSDSRADPLLDSTDLPDVNPLPDRAHLSRRNSRWTHTWAQFVEVVSDDIGNPVALWHGGDGTVTGFRQNPDGSWTPRDSFHALASGGTASTQVDRGDGNQETISVPYGWFEITDEDGTLHRFEQVHWEGGLDTSIPYFLLSRVTDRYGRFVDLAWTNGALQSVQDGDGRGLSFTYTGGLLASISDSLGRTHTLSYTDVPDETGALRSKLTSVQVQGPGSPNRVSYTWTFDYGTTADAVQYYGGSFTGDLVIRRTDPSGRVVHFEYAAVNANRDTYADWDGRLLRAWYADASEGGRVKQLTRSGTTLTAPGGASSTYTYSGHDLAALSENDPGRLTRYTYETWHNPTSFRTNLEPDGSPALLSIGYTYAANGRTIAQSAVTDALGDLARTDLGPFNLPTRHAAFRRQVGGQLYDQVSEWLYSPAGNPLSVTAASGTGVAETTTFTYGSTLAPDTPSAVTDSLNRTWSYSFDARGRVTGVSSPQNLVVAVGHPDRPSSVSTLAYNADELPSLAEDPVGRRIEITYNGIGNSQLEITTRRLADGTTRTTVLDAEQRVISMTDEEGVRTEVTYNGDGQVLTVTEAAGRPEARTTRYEYDLRGDLVKLIPPVGVLRQVQFDYRRYGQNGGAPGVYEGRLTRILHPDGTEEYFGYTEAGELEWESRPYQANGFTQWSVVTYERDALHRVTRVVYPDSPQGVPGFSVETAFDEFGRPKSVSDATGLTAVVYDALDRPVQVLPSGGRKTAAFEYLKDTTFKRWITRTTLVGVGTWEEREDTKGRFSGVLNPFGQAFSLEYNLAGEPTRRYMANGTWSEYGYNPRGLLQTLAHRKADGSLLDQFTYAYYPTGRLFTETDNLNQVHRFVYDALGQLKEEYHPDLGANGIQYQYDANGNRRWVNRNGAIEYYGVDAADKLLWTNTAGDFAPTAGQAQPYSLFQYDYAGQTVRRERRGATGAPRAFDFRWDTDGRLREVKEGLTPVVTSSYASDGERVSKTDLATGVHVYSFGLFDSAGATVYTPGFAQRRGVTDRFFHDDWLGSTRYLTDSGQAVTSAMRFDAYGARSALGGTDGPHPTDYQYAGAHGYQREATDGLDLDYLYQRYYENQTGRFITRDPIRWDGGVNLYGYCENNPVDRVDPDGLRFDYSKVPGQEPALRRMIQELRQSKSTTLKNIIRELDKPQYVIEFRPQRSQSPQSGPRRTEVSRAVRSATTNRPGPGVRFVAISFDPSVPLPANAATLNGTSDNQPKIRLAHELVHAIRFIRGRAHPGVANFAASAEQARRQRNPRLLNFRHIIKDELETGQVENQIRKELGLSLRKFIPINGVRHPIPR
jgi:RHS repeat-associated protein